MPYEGTNAAGLRKAAEAAETVFATSMADSTLIASTLVRSAEFFSSFSEAAAAEARAHIRQRQWSSGDRSAESRRSIRAKRGHGVFSPYKQKRKEEEEEEVSSKSLCNFSLLLRPPSPSLALFFYRFRSSPSLSLSPSFSLTHSLSPPPPKKNSKPHFYFCWTCAKKKKSLKTKPRAFFPNLAA